MKKQLYIIAAIIVAIIASVSTTGCKTGATSAEAAYADSVANNVARLQLKYRQFVLTADRITINNSPILNVSDNTNFIHVDSVKGVVQISPSYFGGPNSVGGITITGDVSNYNIKESKNGDITVSYRVSAAIGSSDVRITLPNGGRNAEATINATFNRNRVTLYGEIRALGSNYYQGRSF